MPNLQKDVHSFLDDHNLRCDPASRALDLASELGEVAKEILKASDYGKEPLGVTDGLREEMGDLAFSLYALAAELEIDLDAAMRAALAKYQTRLANRGEAGSGC